MPSSVPDARAPAVVILAAGAGRRMGKPKIGLVVDGENVLARIVRRLREAHITDIVCVVGDAALVPDMDRVTFVVNPHPERGMLSSLAAGADAVERVLGDGRAIMVAHVDHPHVRAATYAALARESAAHPDSIVKPARDGRTGHPIVLPASVWRGLPPEDRQGGLAAILADARAPRRVVAVDDDGIFRNINTPKDCEDAP